MKSLKILALTFGVLLFSSCGDDATSRINKENAESSELKVAEINKGFPTMTFEKEKHDFGDINEGDIVETVFKFKNDGDTPLIITNARASCGCTIPKYTDKPIQPGEEGEISVKFNSNRKPGKQNKRVTLTTNTEKRMEFVHIMANVAKKETNK
ncbi:MAG: DUF1573 domain-containing protein [Bacteroidota bacterium]